MLIGERPCGRSQPNTTWRSLSAIELNTNVPAELLAADVEVGVGLRVDDADAFLRFADVDDAVAFQA